MTTSIARGLRLLPPPDWTLEGVEIELDKQTRLDMVWRAPWPIRLGNVKQGGDLLVIEVKTGKDSQTLDYSTNLAQADRYVTAAHHCWQHRFLGVAFISLCHPNTSRLYTPTGYTPLAHTPFWWAANGRFDAQLDDF